MENRHDEISANDLLAKLKANMAEAPTPADPSDKVDATDAKKKYHFRRAEKKAAGVTEEEILKEMPKQEDGLLADAVPKAEIEELDIDALMKKYLPEEDYEKMVSRENGSTVEEDELVQTLTSIELVPESTEGEDSDGLLPLEDDGETYAAPDSDLFAHLSRGGKVCDVLGEGEEDDKSDTRSAPLRPMSEETRTIALSGLTDEEDDAVFGSVRELLQAEKPPVSSEESEKAVAETVSQDTQEMAFADEAPTVDLAALLEAIGVTEEEISSENAEDPPILEEVTESEESLSASEDTVVFADFPNPSGDETAVFSLLESEILTEETEEIALVDEEAFDEETESDGSGDPLLAETTILPSMEEVTIEEPIKDEPLLTENDDEVPFVEPLTAEDTLSDGEEGVADAEALVALLAEEDGSSAAEDQATLNETDANLMRAFGMEGALEQAIGEENTDEPMDASQSEESEEKPTKKQKAPATIREFISPAETKDIMESYKAAYGKSALRLFGVIAVAIALFFYENLTIFGGHLVDALNPEYYPVVNAMVGLQILLIGFALCFKNLAKGYKGLVNNEPTSDSFLPLMLLISAIYSVCICLFPAGTPFSTFHFPMSLGLLLNVINERLDLRREIMSFNIVSSKRTKFALEKMDINEAELEARAFDEFLPKSPAIFKINKTSFVDGFFRRSAKYPAIKQILSALIPATMVIMVAAMMVGAFRFRNWYDAVKFGYMAFAFCTPLSAFLAFGLPAFKAAKVAYGMNSTFVGESALDEYTTAASISFDDREVFPTGGVKLRSVKVFGSGRIDTVIYNMASIYSILGGPLSDVLNVATADLGHSDNVEILVIDNEGVEAIVDDHHIFLGKADYLRRHGYVPVADADDEEIEGGGDTGITFLVCDEEVVAKIYIRYAIDPEFEVMLKNLYSSGLCVGIKTVDPNINDAMLSTRIRLEKYPVRVLKYSDVSDTRRGSDRTDSGIVSKKSAKALLRTFTLCDNLKHVTRTNLVITGITMLVGTVIAFAVAILGFMASVASVYIALFQFFWFIFVYLISRFMLM